MARPRKIVRYDADQATIGSMLREAVAVDRDILTARNRINALNTRAGPKGVHPGVLAYIRKLVKEPPAKRAELVRLTRCYLDVLEAESDVGAENAPPRPAAPAPMSEAGPGRRRWGAGTAAPVLGHRRGRAARPAPWSVRTVGSGEVQDDEHGGADRRAESQRFRPRRRLEPPLQYFHQ